MIGTFVFTLFSLSPATSLDGCESLRQSLIDDPALALTWSPPTEQMQTAERPAVHLMSVAGIQIPMPVLPFERIEAMAGATGLSGVRLYSEQHRAEVSIVLQAFDSDTSAEALGFIDATIAGYGMTPEQIDCAAPQTDWQPQLLAMMAKRMQFPIPGDERVYALPDGWLRQGQSEDGQPVQATVYPLNKIQSLAVEWRLPAGHPGLWRVLWAPPEVTVPLSASLEPLAQCLEVWDLRCLQASDAVSFDAPDNGTGD